MSGQQPVHATPRLATVTPLRLVKPAEARPRDPFAHGDLPQRPNYLPEEADAMGDRSEIWAALKGLVVAAGAVLIFGWLLTSG